MLHSMFPGHTPFGTERVFTIYGHDGHLGRATQNPRPYTHFPSVKDVCFDRTCGSRKEMFENNAYIHLYSQRVGVNDTLDRILYKHKPFCNSCYMF